MNFPRLTLRSAFLAALLALAAPVTLSADPNSDLSQAKLELLQHYQNGLTDSDNRVKQLKEKISALEYVVANNPPSARSQSQRLISVDFPGGPASALFAAINKDPNSGLNIIGEKADLVIELPPFAIRNADGISLASALDTLLRQRGYNLQAGYRTGSGVTPVYVLRKMQPHEIPGSGVNFQSFQLGHYLEHQTVDDIVGAIRAAWELDPANKPDALRVKYHPPTGILLVSAPGQGINLVHTVLNQLRKSEAPVAKTERLQAVADEAMKRGQERRKMGEDFEKSRAQNAPSAEKK